MLSPSLEDYLEEIYRLSLSNDVVRVSDVALCLDVTLPSVSNAVRRLSRKNYLSYKRYKEVVLTEKGRRLGAFLVERNKVLQQFLKVIDSDCDIPAEAEAMEHYLTLPTIRAIENLVNFMLENTDYHQKFKEYCLAKKEGGYGLTDGYTD